MRRSRSGAPRGRSPFWGFFLYLNGAILKKTLCRALERRLFSLSSAMAFNTMLSLLPTLLALLTALGIFQESLESLSNLAFQYKKVFPPPAWELLISVVEQISRTQNKSLFSVSFLVAIWVSSGAISTAMASLDEIHKIPRKRRRSFWQAKWISILITLGLIVLLVLASYIVFLGNTWVSLTDQMFTNLPLDKADTEVFLIFWQLFCWPIALSLTITIGALIYQVYRLTKKPHVEKVRRAKSILRIFIFTILIILGCLLALFFLNDLIIRLKFNYTMTVIIVKIWQFLSLPLALTIVSIAFGFLYRVGPSVRNKQMPILPGAIMAAIAWGFVSILFRLYVVNFGSYNKVYGVVGTVILLMIWLQITSLIMLLGDQLNVIVWEAMKKDRADEHIFRDLLPK